MDSKVEIELWQSPEPVVFKITTLPYVKPPANVATTASEFAMER